MPDTLSADPALHEAVRHEALDDIDLKIILRTGFGLGVLVVVSALLMLGLFDWLFAEQGQHYKELPPLAAKERLVFPRDLKKIPGPLLQKSEQEDMDQMRAREDAILSSDKDGVVPIAEALRQMADPEFAAKHGIRVRSPQTKAAKEGKR